MLSFFYSSIIYFEGFDKFNILGLHKKSTVFFPQRKMESPSLLETLPVTHKIARN